MSWLARSMANTLSPSDGDGENDSVSNPRPDNNDQKQNHDTSSLSPPRGVKEDLSELTKTLTRQLWGVASFLAPPPQSHPSEASKSGQNLDPDESDPVKVAGMRSDFAEIGGRFKSGISKFSDNINASEIRKMASNFLKLAGVEDDEEGEGFGSAAVGVTDQVVAFANDIAMHPETWLDFPLPEDQDDDDEEEDFDMSNAQQEHALAVERLAPRLAALRIELCPGYMSERQFWKIYFVLVHPRLGKQDALLLSTPQIMKARAYLAAELQTRRRVALDDKSGEATSLSRGSPPADVPQTTTALESATSTAAADTETEKHPNMCTEIPIVDKSVTEKGHINVNNDENMHSASHSPWEKTDEEDNDDWLKDETSEIGGARGPTIPIDNEEDVSFSDLEEDDGDEPTSFKQINYTSDKDSRDWLELRKSSSDSSNDIKSVTGQAKVNPQNADTNESNDWLDLDDIDVA